MARAVAQEVEATAVRVAVVDWAAMAGKEVMAVWAEAEVRVLTAARLESKVREETEGLPVRL